MWILECSVFSGRFVTRERARVRARALGDRALGKGAWRNCLCESGIVYVRAAVTGLVLSTRARWMIGAAYINGICLEESYFIDT